MEFTKPPKRLDEQIELLKSRGMLFGNEARALHYLRHISYYRLSGYWLPFEADHASHRFAPGTRFEQVLNLYVFDRELRLLVLDAIERVEVSLRSLWAYVMSHRYGAHGHLCADHTGRPQWHQNNLTSLEKELQRSDEAFIHHYHHTYCKPASPPVWAVSEIMSLGLLSRWLTQMKPADRTQIAREYGLDQGLFQAVIRHLTYVRNLSAHHSRLWNRQLTVTMPLPKTRPKVLKPQLNAQETRKIYNTLAVLAWLLDIICPESHWKQRLVALITTHGIDEARMGFPKNWQNFPLWSSACLSVKSGTVEGKRG